MPATSTIAAKGNPRQTLTAITDVTASPGSPSQFGHPWIRWRCVPTQLTALNWESSIHLHESTLMVMGRVHGRTISDRISFFARNSWTSRNAIRVPSRALKIPAITVKTTVFRRAKRKTLS